MRRSIAEAIKDGWLYSGDLGYVDEDGYLFLVDRKKDMLISGGVNVYPRDIEDVVIRHPAVKDVAVFGAPHPKWGEEPVAAVTLHEPIDPVEIVSWINDRVEARYQKVSKVVVLDDFPRTHLGKIDRADFPSRVRNELVRLLPTGVSGKDQVAHMMARILGLRETPASDAADALATAWCHLSRAARPVGGGRVA